MMVSLGRQAYQASSLSRATSFQVSSSSASSSNLQSQMLRQRSVRACLPACVEQRTFVSSSKGCARSMPPTDATRDTADVEQSLADLDSSAGDNEATEQGRREQAEEDEGKNDSLRQGGGARMTRYREWIKGQGKDAFERPPPGRGPFWIGDTPFPLNPSFRPPPPFQHSTKQAMRDLHLSDPHRNSVHELAQRFQMPVARVVAILRLMALESENKKQNKPLQTVFQKEMERLLGAIGRQGASKREAQELPEERGGRSTPPREDLGAGDADANQPSRITPALAQEMKEKATLIRTLPTGSPSSYGEALEPRTDFTETMRTPITYVDMSSRPASYRGAGVVARNQARAVRRSRNRAKHRKLARAKSHASAKAFSKK